MSGQIDEKKMKMKMKHPLEHRWKLTFWPTNEWNNTTNIITISTIEDFWGTYNNIPRLIELGKVNFAFFHDGIRPVWEDDINRKGGKWIWEYSREMRAELDKHWLNLLLFLIGETLQPSSIPDGEIFGCTVHTRPAGDRMTIWTRGTNPQIQKELGQALLEKMKMTGSLFFKAHSDAIQINSSYHSSAKIVLQQGGGVTGI